MLEDPSYSSVVRWGDDGESFVVLENEKFTKAILPKHFKHSNFASFVRQLNKYDFHKVRQNNEDSTPSPYGPNVSISSTFRRILSPLTLHTRHGSSNTPNFKLTRRIHWITSGGKPQRHGSRRRL